MERIRKFAGKDNFAKHIGVELVDVSTGSATTRLKIGKEHLNSHNTVHGGAIFSLADSAFAVACNSHGTVAVAINVSISFVKAISEGTLTAEAREVSLGPKLGNYSIRVTDGEGDLVALFNGLAYRKRDSLPA